MNERERKRDSEKERALERKRERERERAGNKPQQTRASFAVHYSPCGAIYRLLYFGPTHHAAVFSRQLMRTDI